MTKKTIQQQAHESVNTTDWYAENLCDVIWVYGPDDPEHMVPVGKRSDEEIMGSVSALRKLGKKLTWLRSQLVEREQALLQGEVLMAQGATTKLSDLSVLITPELERVRALLKDVRSSKNLAFEMADDLEKNYITK